MQKEAVFLTEIECSRLKEFARNLQYMEKGHATGESVPSSN